MIRWLVTVWAMGQLTERAIFLAKATDVRLVSFITLISYVAIAQSDAMAALDSVLASDKQPNSTLVKLSQNASRIDGLLSLAASVLAAATSHGGLACPHLALTALGG